MYEDQNERIFELLAGFLTFKADSVTAEEVKSLTEDFGVDERTAVALIAAAEMGLDVADDEKDAALFKSYFPKMLKKLTVDDYKNDEYLKRIPFTPCKNKDWEINLGKFKPYELFVRDEPVFYDDGRVIPQIGYFAEEYAFPQILQGGREWMMINPDEVDTQKPYIERAHGKVLTFGLGLGYFAFQCLLKDAVTSVTVVELDENVINLFDRYIRPYFPDNKPFRVIRADAFEYAERNSERKNTTISSRIFGTIPPTERICILE